MFMFAHLPTAKARGQARRALCHIRALLQHKALGILAVNERDEHECSAVMGMSGQLEAMLGWRMAP